MNNSNNTGKINSWLIAAAVLILLGLGAVVLSRGPAPLPNPLCANAELPANAADGPAQAVEIKMITSADYASELDTSDSVLIQMCLPEQCATNRAVLEHVAAGFATVKFVQMSTADNKEFADRLEQEQKLLIEKDSTIKPLSYPVYVYKGADLNTAPVTSEEELKTFIATNVGAAEPESEPAK